MYGYYPFWPKWFKSKDSEGAPNTPQISRLEPHYQIQSTVIPVMLKVLFLSMPFFSTSLQPPTWCQSRVLPFM